MIRAVASIAICVSGAVYGQPAVIQRFEVASIKLSGNTDPGSYGMKTGHGKLDADNVTLKQCIMSAYGVGPRQIFGGPDWVASDHFEIKAKAEKPTDDDDLLMLMLQNLLAERFKLTFHREDKTMTAFVLEAAKNGPKMERAPAGEPGTNRINGKDHNVIAAHNTDMGLFASVLGREMGLPVVNRTGLEGPFNFKLEWIPDNARSGGAGASATVEGPSIFTAVQEQLGLHLRAEKVPVEVLVIDHVEKPSAN